MMLGCGNRQVKQIERTEKDSTEITIKTSYDTVHFKFKWRNADSIPYLFGKPSKDKIAEYQRRFDSLHFTERYGFYDRIEYFRDIPHIIAVNDFVALWFANETPYQDDLDMILWRINECYLLIVPPRKQNCIKDFRNKLIHYYHTRSAGNGITICTHRWQPYYINIK